jgi:hypothetical protein
MGLSTRNRAAYEIEKICWRSLHDPPFRARLSADVAEAVADLPLRDDLRAALIAGDVATLHRAGVAAFLLGYLPRYGVAGLTLAAYNERMRAAE